MSRATLTFRLFVSSTFGDLKEERNALQTWVFPRLRELCTRHGCRFQAIDLRWGVRNESAFDQQTMRICLDEIERCQRITPQPNFIVLLGDRYGWQPVPASIPADEFRIIEAGTGAEDQVLLARWYRRDDNAVPAVYVLQPREGGYKDLAQWEQVERQLRSVLTRAAGALAPEERLKFMTSATEQEIAFGAMTQGGTARNHMFGFFRGISPAPHGRNAADFIDVDETAKRQLAALKERLRRTLGSNIHDYHAVWRNDGPSTDHIGMLPRDLDECLRLGEQDDVGSTLCVDVWRRLSKAILSQIAQLGSMNPVAAEFERHRTWANERAKLFVGRTTGLRAIESYISGRLSEPLMVFGESGAGKTALLAKAMIDATVHITARVVSRFIGATPDSSDGRALLESLCREIALQYGEDQVDLSGDFDDLVTAFQAHLALATAPNPLVLFLDGLDQLSDATQARNLSWLPTSLPPHVRVVMSTGPGECLSAFTRRFPTSGIELKSMPIAEGAELLDLWLADTARTLQPAQRDVVLSGFERVGLPLYLRLAFEQVRRWRSYTDPREWVVSADVVGLIDDLFERLCHDTNHGRVLVSRALGYISAARRGLTEDEILDVLSRDEDVHSDFNRSARYPPPEKRLPFVVWSRLYFDLEPYLATRLSGTEALLTFYHRQLYEAASARFLSGRDGERCHQHLADYFHSQEYFLEPVETQRSRARTSPPTARLVNLRKVDELPWQRLAAGRVSERWDALEALFTDLSFFEAAAEAGFVFALVRDTAMALRQLPASHAYHHILSLLDEAIRQDLYFIHRHPTTLFQCLWNSCWWYDCDQAAEHVDLPESLVGIAGFPWRRTGLRMSSILERWRTEKMMAMPDFVWMRSLRPPAILLRSGQHGILTAGDRAIESVDCSSDGRFIVAGGSDGLDRSSHSVRVWDVESGQQVSCFQGHAEPVTTICFSRDDTRVISGSWAGSIVVSDAQSARELTRCAGHENRITTVRALPDGRSLISSGWDGAIRTWDIDSGELIASWRPFACGVGSFAVSPDGRRIVAAPGPHLKKDSIPFVVLDSLTGEVLLRIPFERRVDPVFSPDGEHLVAGASELGIQIWSAITGEHVASLGGHGERELVHAPRKVAISRDGLTIVSCGQDKTVRLWDRKSGDELACFRGHENEPWDISYLPDGRICSAGGEDGTVRIWSVEPDYLGKVKDDGVDTIQCVTYSPRGTHLVSGAFDEGIVRVWDLRTGQCVRSLHGHKSGVIAAAFDPDARRVATGSCDATIRLWDIHTGDQLGCFEGHESWVTGLDYAPGGHSLASCSWDSTVRTWSVETGQQLLCLKAGNSCYCVAYSPDGLFIAAGVGDDAWIWNAQDGREVRRLRGHRHQLREMAYTADGTQLISWAFDGTVRAWDIATGEGAKIADIHLDVTAVAARDSTLLVAQREEDETVLLSSAGASIAWFHKRLDNVTKAPRRREYAGNRLGHLHIMAVEGL